MRLLLLAAALLLPGCVWTSNVPLYTAADAVQPLAPGLYRRSEAQNPAPIVRVIVMENGLTRFSGDSPRSERVSLGFLALDDSGRRFLAWFVPDPVAPATSRNVRAYLLAERSPAGEFLFYVPDCAGRNAEIAITAGARVEANGGQPTCNFASRGSLERAMRTVVIGPDRLLARLTRAD
jgi:hypothetical protein